MGSFFEALRERYRDHARDDLRESLRHLGVPARLAPRGAREVAIPGGDSLGLVTIPPQGPIRSVNVRNESSAMRLTGMAISESPLDLGMSARQSSDRIAESLALAGALALARLFPARALIP